MKKIFLKKALAVLLLLIIFSLSGCRKSPQNVSSEISSETVKDNGRNYLTLLYSASDTFNPYTAKTDINRQLCQLIYDPLLSLDNEFNPVFKIAESAVVSGKSCTVKLNSIRFSDGSNVTADDVVYSCNLAKSTSGIYSASLYEVKSVSAKDETTVYFSLTKNDPYFINNLTFPIIKAGSEKITDSDSVLQPPVGSGRFKVSDDKLSLIANDNYYGKTGNITVIRLINAPDDESVAHYVEVGAADIYYTSISDGNLIRMSGKKISINLNNLIYIGVNQNYGPLTESMLRQAISTGIDRKKICQDSFYNNAMPAEGFFNPVWNQTKSVQNIQTQSDPQITVEILEKIGYNKFDSKNIRTNESGEKLSFTLLVNSENRIRAVAAQQIASQLKEYGISVTVVEKTFNEYTECLKKGDFQLYLGEIRLTENMDISSLVTEGGSAAYGLKTSDNKDKDTDNSKDSDDDSKDQTDNQDTGSEENQCAVVINGFYGGNNTIADVASVLQTQMPVIPVCYRTGALFYNDNIENINNPSASDIYFSIGSYIYK